MDELRQQLKIALATTFTFYLKVHGCHWNVEGPEFYQFHKLFQKIYEDVYDAVDPMAEHIRTLSTYAPASYKRFQSLSLVEGDTPIAAPVDMVETLISDNAKVIDSLNSAFKAAQTADQQGIANFLADRIDQHQKWGWMLRASNKRPDQKAKE
jgi:starvation-inducible DNA-binding protein